MGENRPQSILEENMKEFFEGIAGGLAFLAAWIILILVGFFTINFLFHMFNDGKLGGGWFVFIVFGILVLANFLWHTPEAVVSIIFIPLFYFKDVLFPVPREPTEEQIAQQKMDEAGLEAELYIRNLLCEFSQELHKEDESCIVQNNMLFVFNEGLHNEYSAEVDHLVITKKNIFAVETKYKSGVVKVDLDADSWDVVNNGYTSQMRNALKQIKQTVKVLAREIRLSTKIIPIVVIYGNDTYIESAPSNVVADHNLLDTLRAFELAAGGSFKSELPGQTPEEISKFLMTFCRDDQKSLSRHVERAKASREKHKVEHARKALSGKAAVVIQNASLD
jgi:hypothetical protein